MELEKRNWKKVIRVLACVWLLVGTSSCRQSKKYHDRKPEVAAPIYSEKSSVLSMSQDSLLKAVLSFQEDLNNTFKDPEDSPLTPSDKMVFESLDYYPPNAQFIVQARLQRTPETLPFSMPTTTERMSEERLFGTLHFQIQGKSFSLNVYESQDLLQKEGYEDYLFLPFTDLTNGTATYGGGRYLDLRLPKGDSILLDFNRAYNPYCAYNKKFSCPIVPSENHLDIQIEAGVKAFD